MHYLIHVSYDGTRYSGWQRQGNCANTITAKLEAVLSRLDDREVKVDGAGRTDAGVHAIDQTATFDLASSPDCGEVLAYANRYLPEDIAVIGVQTVPQRFHARLHSVGKIYRYEIRTSPVPDVFRRKYQWHLQKTPDAARMRKAAEQMTGTHDFASFCTARPGSRSTVRTLKRAEILQEGGTIQIEYEGNGFLYNMVRIMTGTLVEVGLGQREPEDIAGILSSRNRANAGITAPAQGLTLVRVLYDPIEASCGGKRA